MVRFILVGNLGNVRWLETVCHYLRSHSELRQHGRRLFADQKQL